MFYPWITITYFVYEKILYMIVPPTWIICGSAIFYIFIIIFINSETVHDRVQWSILRTTSLLTGHEQNGEARIQGNKWTVTGQTQPTTHLNHLAAAVTMVYFYMDKLATTVMYSPFVQCVKKAISAGSIWPARTYFTLNGQLKADNLVLTAGGFFLTSLPLSTSWNVIQPRVLLINKRWKHLISGVVHLLRFCITSDPQLV